MKGDNVWVFVLYFMIMTIASCVDGLKPVEQIEILNDVKSGATPINDEQVIELLHSKTDNFFILGYNKQANIDTINKVLNEIHDILSSSSVSLLKFYTVDSEKSVSFQQMVGDIPLSSVKLVYANKGKHSIYEGEFNYDQVSDWVFTKYSVEEKEQINSTIKKQTNFESGKLSGISSSSESNKNEEHHDENSNSECKENPINLVKGSVEKLKEEVSKLEEKLSLYKKKLEDSKVKLPEANIHQIKPINIAISVIILLVIVASVIVFCKMTKKKKHISII